MSADALVRNKTLKNYGLCPSYCFSAPALSWYPMLNIAKVEFKLISDADMHSFLQKGMRGGVCYISKRYSNASKKFLQLYYSKQSQHVQYFDANNFYGYALHNFLPTGGFRWIDPKEFDSNKYSSNSRKGCILDVFLEYPKT